MSGDYPNNEDDNVLKDYPGLTEKLRHFKENREKEEHQHGKLVGPHHSSKISASPETVFERQQKLVEETSQSMMDKGLVRQNSLFISTDSTGAAVQTINNILNGITDSVNRLSELQCHVTETPRTKRVVDSNLLTEKNHKMAAGDETQIINKMLSSGEETENLKWKRKKLSMPNKLGANMSTQSIRKKHKSAVAKHSDRKSKLNIVKSKETDGPVSEFASQLLSTKSPIKKAKALTKAPTPPAAVSIHKKISGMQQRQLNKSTHNLVEIYHNQEAKESDSDELEHKTKIDVRVNTAKNFVPPISIPEKMNDACNLMVGGQNHQHFDEFYKEPIARRSGSSTLSRSYEQPTIASRMKQVYKLGYSMFNFKAIPFCPAMSTSPSHNIGINIQQVMSILKNRQPVQGISPTLAHNIGLAAERLNNKPLTALVTSMTARLGYGRSFCPLTKTSLNYQYLQEIAKNVPADIIEEPEEDMVVNIKPNGPYGDELKATAAAEWAVAQNPTQCTCLPQQGVDFQHVYNKYKNKPTVSRYTKFEAITSSTTAAQDNQNNQINNKYRTQKFMTPAQQRRIIRSHVEPAMQTVNEHPVHYMTYNKDVPPEHNPTLEGREKSLKEILTNLHDEFEAMNNKYELLCAKSNENPADEEILKELEMLEVNLERKEDEITMVLNLYKEVLALKEQVKQLKTQTSQGSIPIKKKLSSNTYTNPTAAHHLTKLLHQIQHYQTFYKNAYI